MIFYIVFFKKQNLPFFSDDSGCRFCLKSPLISKWFWIQDHRSRICQFSAICRNHQSGIRTIRHLTIGHDFCKLGYCIWAFANIVIHEIWHFSLIFGDFCSCINNQQQTTTSNTAANSCLTFFKFIGFFWKATMICNIWSFHKVNIHWWFINQQLSISNSNASLKI